MAPHSFGGGLTVFGGNCLYYFPMFGRTSLQASWICLGIHVSQMMNTITHLDHNFTQ